MNKLNIVADENMAGVVQSFGEFGSVRLLNGRAICAGDLREADVLLVRSVTRVNEALLAASSVKFVVQPPVGSIILTGITCACGVSRLPMRRVPTPTL